MEFKALPARKEFKEKLVQQVQRAQPEKKVLLGRLVLLERQGQQDLLDQPVKPVKQAPLVQPDLLARQDLLTSNRLLVRSSVLREQSCSQNKMAKLLLFNSRKLAAVRLLIIIFVLIQSRQALVGLEQVLLIPIQRLLQMAVGHQHKIFLCRCVLGMALLTKVFTPNIR